MRHPITVFRRTPATPPSPSELGIAIATPAGRRGPARGGVVRLHGAITILREEAEQHGESWIFALAVTAVTEIDQVPQIAPLWQRAALHAPPSWSLQRDGLHASLPFCVDLGVAFRYPLHGEPVYVHVSARELSSEIVRVGLDPLAAPTTLADDDARLDEAYDRARLGDWPGAADLFEALLDDPARRDDLDGCHRYNYACVLTRLGQHERALELLRADTRRRAQPRIQALIESLTMPTTEPAEHTPARARQAAELREHFAHLAHDPDLEPLGDARDPRNLLR